MPPPGGKITVTDEYGYLPKNPDEWPERLKQEIRDCCCGASTSQGGGGTRPPLTYHGIGCCPREIPSSLSGNITNTLTHNTGINWTYVQNVTLYPNGNGPEILPPGYPRAALPTVPDPNPYLFQQPPTGPITYNPCWYSDFFLDYDGGRVSGETPVQFLGFPVNPPLATYVYDYTFKVYYYAVFGYLGRNQNTLPGCAFEIFQCCFPTGRWTINTPGWWSYAVNPNGTWIPPTTFSADITYHDNYNSPAFWGGLTPPPPGVSPYGGLGGIIPVNPYFGSTSNTAGWRTSAVMRYTASYPVIPFTSVDWFKCNPFLEKANWHNVFNVEEYRTSIVSTQGTPEPYVPYNVNAGGAIAPIIWCPDAVIEPGVNYFGPGSNNYGYLPGRPTIEIFE